MAIIICNSVMEIIQAYSAVVFHVVLVVKALNRHIWHLFEVLRENMVIQNVKEVLFIHGCNVLTGLTVGLAVFYDHFFILILLKKVETDPC